MNNNNNNNNNLTHIKQNIKQKWALNLLILIHSCILTKYNNYYYLFIILILLISIKFEKYWWWVWLVPSIKHKITFYKVNGKTCGIIYYSIKTKCKKNTYLIKIHKVENINENVKYLDNKLGVFLYAKCSKDYFSTYKSQVYIINENFLFETFIVHTKKSRYKKFLENIYNKVLKFSDYPYIINCLLLSIKDKHENYKFFKETGTWHLLCVGGYIYIY